MNKEEILNRLIQKSICINAGGKGCYNPYTNDMDWFSDIDNLILMYEQLQRENKELNQKYLNAVADYETAMFEKEQLNRLVNSCQEEIRQLKKQLEELKQTNKVLSEELTKDKILKQDCLTTCCGIPIGDIPKLINQQKEFIDWLEENYKNTQDIWYIKILNKYKEIIGGK